MPLIDANGLRQYYRLDGPDDRPVVFLSHSLGCDQTLWDIQAGALAPHFRVLRYDIRGHGATGSPPGDYTIDMLARDALALADALGIREFAWCGLSLGGAIGQWLGAHASDRLTALVLANTSPYVADRSLMDTRRRTVLESGMDPLVDSLVARFFTPERLPANRPEVAGIRRVLLANSPEGYAGCCAAIRDMDLRPLLPSISVPTLIVAGDHDIFPWQEHGGILAAQIPGAKVIHLPAAHLSNLEAPRAFNAALFRFLLPAADTLEAGFEKRRAILGNAHVDRAIANTTDFNRPFQELVTRFAWGSVWQRPGLDDRTRRLLVLTATAALGRWEEFRMHVRAALAAGMEPADLQETLLQLALYAGLPAANTGFQIAAEEVNRT